MSAKVPDSRRGHERQGDEPPPAGHPSNPTPESGTESGPPTTLHDSATTEYFTQPSAGENTKAIDSGSGAHRAAAKRPESNAPDSTETAEFDSKALPGNSAPAGESRTAETLPTIRQFLRSIVKLGLISLEDAEPMTEGFADVAELARALVKAGKLTPYQAGAAAHGKSKGLAIGRYIILDRLGAGGMGVVFKAKHRVTARVVALKILLPSLTEKRDAVARFRREAEAAARLNHINVVSVLDADTDRGVHFLVLDYVEGCDLDRYVRQRGPLSVEQGIDALAQAARGLAAAHGHGIIHRDIKPGNLILDRDGTVKVLDLGLAKLIAAANQPTPGWKTGTALTLAHTYMGTVDFMAPEQADDSRSADHRADVYSLGCTIFYLLTGRAPFQAPSILKRLIEHQERPAPSLVEARPETPPSLEALYQSMMAKSPEDRPGSMAEVVSRLEACRQEAARKGGTPATARMSPPPPAPTPVDPIAAIRLSEDEGSLLPKSGSGVANDRGRLVSMVASAVVTLTLIVGGFVLIPKRGQPPATANAKADPDGADEESKALEGRPSGPAGEKAAPAPVAEDTTPEPLVEVARIHCDDSRTVEAVCVTPDGKTVASTSANGLVQVWDPNTGREVKRLWGPGTVRGMAITRDGRHLLNGDADGKLRNWDLSTGRQIRTTPLIKGRMMALALSRDGRWIAAGGDDADLVLLNGEGREIRRLSAPAAIYSLAFAKDSRHVLAGCSNGAVVLFDVAGREKPAVLTPGLPRSDEVPDVAIWGLAVSEDGQYAISAGGEGTARLWDLAGLKEVRKTKLPGGKIRGVCFVSGAPRAVLAVQQGQFTLAGTIATWDYEASVGARPSGRGAAPLGLASMPGGGFASADADGSIRIYAPSRPLEAARRLAAEGKLDEALKHYGEAIQARPRDARLLIERARWLARLGKGSEADADFARAGELADNPQLFLDAGWWIAGLYPKWDREATPELPQGLDPSTSPPSPVPGSTSPGWWPITPRGHGFVHFSSLLGTIAPRSGLALTYVASASSREVALSMKTDDWGQLWINGERALSTAGGAYATPWTDKRRLDAGKSTFVSSVVNELGGHYLELRISDDPIDLARAEMNRGEWNTAEAHLTSALTASPSVPDDYRLRGDARALTSRWLDAASDFDQAGSIRPDDPADRIRAAYARLAAEDHARARELCRHLSAGPKLAETDPAFRDLHRLLAAVPGAISDGFPAIADVEKAEASKEALPMTGLHGAMLYRVGRWKAAAASLKHAIDAEKGKASATTWAYYALALAKLREPQPRVRETLDRAEALAKDERDALLDAARRDSSRWMELVALDSVLREARAVQPPTSQERRRPNPAALPR